jgi:cytochrome c peroxidase
VRRKASRRLNAFVIAAIAYAGFAKVDEIAQPLGLPPAPAKIAGTTAMRGLGEKLFFDRALSANGTLSCAMCHIPGQGFASNQSARSIGMEGRSLRRNAPSLYNVAFKRFLFHDGRETDLAAQVWGPLLAPDEMGNTGIGPLLERLRKSSFYGPLFEVAFPGEGVSMNTLGCAIAAYEATLLRGDSRFDRALFSGEKNALTPQEWRGYGLFVSKAGCSSCHMIDRDSSLFTDQSFHNTGVAFRSREVPQTVSVRLAPGIVKEVTLTATGLSEPPARNDVGRFEITNNPADRWAYATPMLRGVKDSWPYMHDGSLNTLEEVIEFYDRGGGPNPNLDPKIKPLGLTEEEKKEILAFLRTL